MPAEVGAPAVDRREVELEVAGVQHDALRRVHRDGVGVRHRVGDRDELDVERADPRPLAVGDGDHVAAAEQAGLLDAVAGQAERERGAVDRERLVAEVPDAVVSRSRNWMPPTWSSWPWVATQADDASRRCSRR